jgi:Tfp pilus assembly protein PilF
MKLRLSLEAGMVRNDWKVGVLAAAMTLGCVSEHRMQLAQTHVDLGTAYYREGNIEGAITMLQDATKEDPGNWRAVSNLGVAYAAAGRVEMAGKCFAHAARMVPDEGEVLLNYGAFLVNTGRAEEAVPVLSRGLHDLDYPNGSMLLSNLAKAYTAVGRHEEAVKSAREAVRRSPKLCQGWFNLGLAQEARGDAPAALEAYQELESTCPSEALGAKLRTGCILAGQGRTDAAAEPLEAVIDGAAGTTMADAARACLAPKG